jgi:hypothetical protein
MFNIWNLVFICKTNVNLQQIKYWYIIKKKLELWCLFIFIHMMSWYIYKITKKIIFIKLHVMFSGINEWLYMLNFFVHINITT